MTAAPEAPPPRNHAKRQRERVDVVAANAPRVEETERASDVVVARATDLDRHVLLAVDV